MGAWAIGGPWTWGWGEQNDNDSLKTIRKSFDVGINWIDTAAVYGLGYSEEIVGKAVKGIRHEIIIATKCGMPWNNKGKIRNDLKPDSIRREIENSLRRLNTDYIDLYQFHWPDPNSSVEKSWEEMIKLKEEGKIRYLGVSNFNIELMQKCENLYHVDSLQPPYNMLERDIETEILPYCQENGTGVIAYSPMKSGLLTGKFDPARLTKGDWRLRAADFKEPKLLENLKLIEEIKQITKKYGKTVGQLAIAWTLKHSALTAAIVGARKPDQVAENAGAVDFQIEDEDYAAINLLLD